MFFNPRQFRVREGIVNSLEKFGHPRLEETGQPVRAGRRMRGANPVRFGPGPHAQRSVGIVVFIRTSPAEIAIMHIAVHPDYGLQGGRTESDWASFWLKRSRRLPRELWRPTDCFFLPARSRNTIMNHFLPITS